MAQATTLNYYKVLGVTQKTSKGDLKKKYRELAKKYHPDTNLGSKAAEDKFKIISEAYEVLSNAKRDQPMTASGLIRKDLHVNQKDSLIGTHLPVVSERDRTIVNRAMKSLSLKSRSPSIRICQRVDSTCNS